MPLSPRQLAPARVALALGLGLAAIGCGAGDQNPGDSRFPGQVIRLDSGPLKEIRVARDTDAGFVVTGICYFPDGTVLTVALYDSLGHVLGQTRPVVRNGLFTSLPLNRAAEAAAPHEIGVSAQFAPEEQSAAVLEEAAGGKIFEGEGMFITQRGYPAFALRFPVEP